MTRVEALLADCRLRPESCSCSFFSVAFASGSPCSFFSVASDSADGGRVPHFSLSDGSVFAGLSRACNCLLRFAIVSWHSASFLAAADIAEVCKSKIHYKFFSLYLYKRWNVQGIIGNVLGIAIFSVLNSHRQDLFVTDRLCACRKERGQDKDIRDYRCELVSLLFC